MDWHRPYLSVVVATRNDDHGGNLSRRTQTFLNALAAQCARHRVPTELVMVEWNPPAGRPSLSESLKWPEKEDWFRIRIIRVPAGIHARYRHRDALPLYQMIAKNAGIRRARGEFILATNIDILFSSELMAFIAGRRLEKGRMYRIDRLDAAAGVPLDASAEEQLEYCRTNLLRVNCREFTFPVTREGLPLPAEPDIVPPGSGILLGRGWYPPEEFGELFRWMGQEGEIILAGGEKSDALLLEVEPSQPLIQSEWRFELAAEDRRVIQSARLEGRTTVLFRLPRSAQRRTFRLRLAGLDHIDAPSLPGDTRYLSLRVFRCEWGNTESPRPMEAHGWWRRRLTAWLDGGVARWGSRISVPANEPFQTPGAAQLASTNHYLHYSGHAGVYSDVQTPSEGARWKRIFRWASSGARLLIRSPRGWSGDFRLLIAKGWRKRVTVEVRDHQGQVIARKRIGPVGWLKIPQAGHDETRLLCLHQSEPAGEQQGFFILNYGWGVHGKTSALMGKLALENPHPGQVKLGKGWRMATDGAWEALDGAELVMRRSRTSADLLLGVEPLGEPDNAPRRWRIATGLGPGELGVVRLQSRGGTEPFVRLNSLDWAATKADSKFRPMPNLHIQACGDFTLLHRDHWLALRGYAEFDLYSMNLDALFCWSAYFSGIDEVVLREPMRIYHIEHDMASGWTPDGQASLFARLGGRGVGWLDYGEVLRFAQAMHRLRKPMIFNGGNWGLGADDLEEMTP